MWPSATTKLTTQTPDILVFLVYASNQVIKYSNDANLCVSLRKKSAKKKKKTNKQNTTAPEDEYSASTPKDVISDSLLILISLEHDRFTTQPFCCTIVYVCAYA